jgi:hypothetical protein
MALNQFMELHACHLQVCQLKECLNLMEGHILHSLVFIHKVKANTQVHILKPQEVILLLQAAIPLLMVVSQDGLLNHLHMVNLQVVGVELLRQATLLHPQVTPLVYLLMPIVQATSQLLVIMALADVITL